MCEECGYTLLHGIRCPQRQSPVVLRCRICDAPIDKQAKHLSLARTYICCDCAEEMDQNDIKELFGFGNTFELIARLCENTDFTGDGNKTKIRQKGSFYLKKPLQENRNAAEAE